MGGVAKEAQDLDELTDNVKKMESERNTTVEDLSKGFETNILNSFSPEALATAAQEIVDDSIKKGDRRKRNGNRKTIVMTELTKIW
eukprot:CAMPEP_0119036874 /NCGR_PEP_ID=MMETSP1177-20130426/4886_1 /TAXON_ID=2985 /ORGANISM="Ochromonas sp, Strain CCMP1899" /LENGTH=85 /DNA_ID=CAMNT_0006997351 /DNA_START=300 /DNA_END=554 /DNA_ORIENTATION=-